MKKLLKITSYLYLFTWVFSLLLYLFFTFSRIKSFSKFFRSFWELATSKGGLLFIHITFLIVAILYLIVRYFVRVYKKGGFKMAFVKFLIQFAIPISCVFFILKYIIDNNSTEDFNYNWEHSIENKTNYSAQKFLEDGKFRGMNFYRAGRRNSEKSLNELIKSNIEWVAVLPYLYQKDENTTEINPKTIKNEWNKRDSAFIKDIQKIKNKGVFVMLKPHIWMSSGWRSNINFNSENDWNKWFKEYKRVLLHYARLAQTTNVELLCIGTELRSSLNHQPKKWLALIDDIKLIYKGKLTYAANWDDDFNQSLFWNKLDYIGIQAYYPLTKSKDPSIQEIKRGWQPHIEKIEKIHNQHQKQILFTEIGYRNDIYATIEPWSWGSFFQRLYRKKSDKVQYLAYQALYEELWDKPWFAGTFPWEWNSSDFPIYKKPAQNIIAIWYAN